MGEQIYEFKGKKNPVIEKLLRDKIIVVYPTEF